MKAVRWTRFTWNAAALPTPAPTLPPRYTLRTAHRDDLEVVKQVIFGAFALDSAWSDAMATARDWLEHGIALAFERESVPALVIQHGQRIIAASALNTEVAADTHLISGPCVLMEYHNRGIGSALLYYSLKQLRESGLESVSGVSKENVAVAKFIYPKFGSRQSVHAFEPGLAPT
jgi:N-acetylglutamate synthase-like GNAT family acetyltransferase